MKTLEDFANIYCSQELTAQILDNQIICLSVINTLLAITAIVGNTLILIALRKENALHQPSKVIDSEYGGQRFLCWLCRTCFSWLMGFHSGRTLAKLSLLLSCLYHGSFHFDISVIMHVNRHKH